MEITLRVVDNADKLRLIISLQNCNLYEVLHGVSMKMKDLESEIHIELPLATGIIKGLAELGIIDSRTKLSSSATIKGDRVFEVLTKLPKLLMTVEILNNLVDISSKLYTLGKRVDVEPETLKNLEKIVYDYPLLFEKLIKVSNEDIKGLCKAIYKLREEVPLTVDNSEKIRSLINVYREVYELLLEGRIPDEKHVSALLGVST